jgi:hypothetical protein
MCWASHQPDISFNRNSNGKQEGTEEDNCPLDWKRTTVDEIVEQKRRLGEKYKWLGDENAATSCCWKAGMEKSGGNRKPET